MAECFGFLYDHPSDSGYGIDRDDYRVYKSRDISGAALKMARFIERKGWVVGLVKVDYEVDHDGGYVDLYTLGQNHPIYPFLP